MAEQATWRRVLAAIAGTLAILAALVGANERRAGVGMAPLELARLIRTGKPGILVIDLRSPDDFAGYALPFARHHDLDDSSTASWPVDATIVVYAEVDTRARGVARRLRARGAWEAYALEGGVRGWIEQVERPRLPPLRATASASDSAVRREHLALSRHFGGLPVVDPALPPVAPQRGAQSYERSAAVRDSAQAAVGALRRRGC